MNNLIDLVADSQPDKHFIAPPYHVESFPIGSCVCNAHGYNLLQFKSYPGAKFTTKEVAEAICEKWNA